jgi:Zn-dependent peptidase ImmA (M78 family)
MRRIFKHFGIRVDYRALKTLRGAYFGGTEPSVLIAKALPDEPKIFTLGHELKHHFFDGDVDCHTLETDDVIEIGAEVFGAELLFPEKDFCQWCTKVGLAVGSGTPEQLVSLKRETQTTLSYAGLAKRSIRLGYLDPGVAKTQWKKLEEKLYGEPAYKRIRRRTQAKARFTNSS